MTSVAHLTNDNVVNENENSKKCNRLLLFICTNQFHMSVFIILYRHMITNEKLSYRLADQHSTYVI